MDNNDQIDLLFSEDALQDLFGDLHLNIVIGLFSYKKNRNILSLSHKNLSKADLISQKLICKIIMVRFLEDQEIIPDNTFTKIYSKFGFEVKRKSFLRDKILEALKKILSEYSMWNKEDERLYEIILNPDSIIYILEELTRLVCDVRLLNRIKKIAQNYLLSESIISNLILTFRVWDKTKTLNKHDKRIHEFYQMISFIENLFRKKNVNKISQGKR
ncbi:MAG: hypothetical protein ACTSUV_04390 [Candidatus Ranarchaeia archaeon]